MKPRKATYIVHRWVGLVISLQLLAWSVGGFVFSILDIQAVRGALDARDERFVVLDEASADLFPLSVRETISRAGVGGAAHLALVDRGLGPFWEVRDVEGDLLVRISPDGELAGLLTGEDARSIALRDFVPEAEVLRVELIESSPPVEFRGRPLPAYRVELDHAKRPHIYVDARTGEITARRNRSWRIFDFFWMLHTMDYKGRDDFNHPLLTAASVLAVVTSGAGLALWGWRVAPRTRRSGG